MGCVVEGDPLLRQVSFHTEDCTGGQNATFDGQAQLGACYKGNMLCKILEGTVTWTADQGSWAPESGRIDFDWSGDTCCTYSCCLSQSPLSASNNMANLV